MQSELHPSTPAASLVRDQVLAQHASLRALLANAVARSRPAETPARDDLLALAHLAHEIRRRFRTHLAFEERLLIPVLSSSDVWGPERVRNLTEEHASQRADLDSLIEGVERGWDEITLAAALRTVALALLRDMDEEERDYLSRDLIGD
jgi:iron-sulfur cluster repair protein YtfE (RIC family)